MDTYLAVIIEPNNRGDIFLLLPDTMDPLIFNIHMPTPFDYDRFGTYTLESYSFIQLSPC